MPEVNHRTDRVGRAVAEAAEAARRREAEPRLTRDDVVAQALDHYGLSPAFAAHLKARTPTAIRREVARLVLAQSTIAAAEAGAASDAQAVDD
ncbi:hypothetical protein Q2K19_10585 [Micromonospora soli]|uniref:hypothetical protein n=1 Tax=Micromonospora sp. NBRC 110009 TaxID=3061627 RepID=UPI002673EA33|nr:hypothetical protein [Micromonospora sp. NBRC 110009]WKU00884.1 hypothetical protein Q2K19_10585 [Micromonospora sp. NBRC 110009]